VVQAVALRQVAQLTTLHWIRHAVAPAFRPYPGRHERQVVLEAQEKQREMTQLKMHLVLLLARTISVAQTKQVVEVLQVVQDRIPQFQGQRVLLVLMMRPGAQEEQVVMEAQFKQPVILQLNRHWEPVEAGMKPVVQEEQVVVELQKEQLAMEQLKRQVLALRKVRLLQAEQVVVELQMAQLGTEGQVKMHWEALGLTVMLPPQTEQEVVELQVRQLEMEQLKLQVLLAASTEPVRHPLQTLVALQVAQKGMEQLNTQLVALALRRRPPVQLEQVLVELQNPQLLILQLKVQVLLNRIEPGRQAPQTWVLLQLWQLGIEQL
jgi:hypothetical protein